MFPGGRRGRRRAPQGAAVRATLRSSILLDAGVGTGRTSRPVNVKDADWTAEIVDCDGDFDLRVRGVGELNRRQAAARDRGRRHLLRAGEHGSEGLGESNACGKRENEGEGYECAAHQSSS